ncbi:hypothetical protein BP6252_04964 [Coleophoma cylindrospora]|uniref:Major facilitator superfamily (MFS) profile domain-containing protein n=1 Tax=Coleophoma cylindrospora TaxID=1849047 RepID=A0A3D8RSX0_9HELO|nr:hypothetical protein BP6252_04964 [Coleophoma cylindrospora]
MTNHQNRANEAAFEKENGGGFSAGATSYDPNKISPLRHERRRLGERTSLSSNFNKEVVWHSSGITVNHLTILEKESLGTTTTEGPPICSAGSGFFEAPGATLSQISLRRQAAAPPPPAWSRYHEIAFIVCVCLAQFLSLACLAQTVALSLIIGNSFNVENPGQLSWFTASYSMTLGTFILPAGRLGDMFGHKRIYILGWLWLALWCCICGFAHSWGPVVFSVARGCQGIAPALLVPNAIALIGRTFPVGEKRALVLSLVGACGPTGFLTGAAMSSLLAQLLWWPWVFWVTAISAICITFFATCIVPDSMAMLDFPPGVTKPTFDYLGCFTGVSGLLLVNFALNQAPLAGWSEPYVYSLLITGFLLILAFFCVEFSYSPHPLLPVRELYPQAWILLACIAAGWASHGIWIYYFFRFLTSIRNLTPLEASLELVPVAPVGIAFALSTNYLIKRIHVSKIMLLSMIFFLVGSVLLAFAPADQTYWAQTFLSVLITPGGMNLSFPAGTILISNAMLREHQGKAGSLITTVINYSIASGLGLAGSIEKHIDSDHSRLLDGYRGAWELGIGFSALGVMISMYFVWKSAW